MADDSLLGEISGRESAVNGMIGSKSYADALILALEGADKVMASKNQTVKEANAKVVFKVMVAVSDKDIEDVLANFNPVTLDLLMKYVYKGLQNHEHSTHGFKWHSAILEKTGLGSIVRTMTDRKTV